MLMKQRIAELTSLEELFEDVFAAGYMLRFTEAEFSSENVAFILAVLLCTFFYGVDTLVGELEAAG